MAIPFNLIDLISRAPANKIVDQNLINARNIFGIQDPYLLKDYTDYYMNKPIDEEGLPSIVSDMGTVPSREGGGGEREELGPASPRNIGNTGDGLFAKSVSRANNTGGITNALIDMENLSPIDIGTVDDYNDLNEYERAVRAANISGTLREAPDVFDVDKVGIKDPSIMKIANYDDLFTDERFSLPEDIQERNKRLVSIRDFLPFGRYSITGALTKGLGSLNDQIQSSNLGRSTSLADYRDMMSYGGYEEREAAREKTMQEARDLQKLIDLRKTSIPTDQDKGKGQPPPGPPTTTKDYGRDSSPNNPNSTKNKTKSKGYSYADTPGGGRDGGGGGDHDGGASAGAQGDAAAGAGGYRRGGRVKYLYGGLTSL
tara:strand:+ start:111 stop:1226 length:1116 start_codon:yes stop_codon:yes gene_type:complete